MPRVLNCRLVCLLWIGLNAWAQSTGAYSTSQHSIVLITLDTTRADHLGSYGWRYAQTPNLDALARRGTRFTRCDTAAPITLPSHATILTGLYPVRHGIRDNSLFTLSAGVDTVASSLQRAGYDTGAVVSAIILARQFGLDRGFRIYDDDMGVGYAAGTEVSERTAEATTRAALAVLKQLKPPFFLWVHYYDPHEEYRPPTRFADAISGPSRLYDGEIAFVDEQVGVLMARLPANTGIAVVGDHGEMLGEHGELTHGLLPYRGARRVPLILAGPRVPAGQTVQCLVRTADVAPTLLSWGGIDQQALDGKSLLPLPTGNHCDRVSYTESFLPFFSYKWYPLRSISDGLELYIQAPVPSLYILSDDPNEENDRAISHPEDAARWAARLHDFLTDTGDKLNGEVLAVHPLPEEQRKLLSSLGYVSESTGGRVGNELPDPRAKTAEALRLHGAVSQIQEGNCAKALPDLRIIVKDDPHNFAALNFTAQCLQGQGQYEQALVLFRQAALENDRSAVPAANIAGCLLKLGRKDEAVEQYRQALSLDPTQPESAANLARLLREQGHVSAALEVVDNAILAGCHAPSVFLERGLTLAESGRLAEALVDFREAARKSPADPVPLENAARASYQLGNYLESAQLYEQLLRISPNQSELWKTLGAIYLYHLGDRGQSLRAFREALRLEQNASEKSKLEDLVRELEK